MSQDLKDKVQPWEERDEEHSEPRVECIPRPQGRSGLDTRGLEASAAGAWRGLWDTGREVTVEVHLGKALGWGSDVSVTGRKLYLCRRTTVTKHHELSVLKQIEINFFQVLEAKSLRSRCQQGSYLCPSC